MTTYSQEFKDQIVELHRGGRSFSDLAREFNLAATSISNWVRDADRREGRGGQPSPSTLSQPDKERIRQLEKELARKQEELDILGKALAFFARRADQ
jgi:transposase